MICLMDDDNRRTFIVPSGNNVVVVFSANSSLFFGSLEYPWVIQQIGSADDSLVTSFTARKNEAGTG